MSAAAPTLVYTLANEISTSYLKSVWFASTRQKKAISEIVAQLKIDPNFKVSLNAINAQKIVIQQQIAKIEKNSWWVRRFGSSRIKTLKKYEKNIDVILASESITLQRMKSLAQARNDSMKDLHDELPELKRLTWEENLTGPFKKSYDKIRPLLAKYNISTKTELTVPQGYSTDQTEKRQDIARSFFYEICDKLEWQKETETLKLQAIIDHATDAEFIHIVALKRNGVSADDIVLLHNALLPGIDKALQLSCIVQLIEKNPHTTKPFFPLTDVIALLTLLSQKDNSSSQEACLALIMELCDDSKKYYSGRSPWKEGSTASPVIKRLKDNTGSISNNLDDLFAKAIETILATDVSSYDDETLLTAWKDGSWLALANPEVYSELSNDSDLTPVARYSLKRSGSSTDTVNLMDPESDNPELLVSTPATGLTSNLSSVMSYFTPVCNFVSAWIWSSPAPSAQKV